MKTVGAYEARTHFSELLREAEQGETIVVTRHGVAVARIVPAEKDPADVAAAIEELHRLRRAYGGTLGDITIKELIEEGRE